MGTWARSSGSCSVPRASCSCPSGSFSSARCAGSSSSSTVSTRPQCGIGASPWPARSSSASTSRRRATRTPPSWARRSARSASSGLATLTVWAIAPRWRSITPRPLRQPVLSVMETPPVRFVGRWIGSYGLWRGFHRLTGLFLAFGFVHGLMDATVFGSQLLRWTYVAAGGIGLAFYLYRELLARHFARTHDYEVSSVDPIDDASYEIWLRPLGDASRSAPASSPSSTSKPATAGTATPSPSPAPRREGSPHHRPRARRLHVEHRRSRRAGHAGRHQQPTGAFRLHAGHRAPGVGRGRDRGLADAQLAPLRQAR